MRCGRCAEIVDVELDPMAEVSLTSVRCSVCRAEVSRPPFRWGLLTAAVMMALIVWALL